LYTIKWTGLQPTEEGWSPPSDTIQWVPTQQSVSQVKFEEAGCSAPLEHRSVAVAKPAPRAAFFANRSSHFTITNIVLRGLDITHRPRCITALRKRYGHSGGRPSMPPTRSTRPDSAIANPSHPSSPPSRGSPTITLISVISRNSPDSLVRVDRLERQGRSSRSRRFESGIVFTISVTRAAEAL
jgi:hypothetical protein